MALDWLFANDAQIVAAKAAHERQSARAAGCWFDWAISICKSPIECLLFAGLTQARVFCHTKIDSTSLAWTILRQKCPKAATEMMNVHEVILADSVCSFLFLQVPALKYRLDFAVAIEVRRSRQKQWRWIAVECDGHDFHERTKEQAAHDRKRDRAFVADGWTVVRFTGSELQADATRCANELVKIAALLSQEAA